MTSTRSSVAVLVMLGVLLLGGGAWGISKTKWFHGESKRAATSTSTTNDLLAAKDKQGAVAAASVVKIGEANQVAPESPSRSFIAREVPVALASLPPPDADALLAAERRKAAVLEGRLVEADKLYGDAIKLAGEYQKEAARAVAAKRASDLALEQAAAETRGAEQNQFWLTLLAIAVGLLWAWTKLTHASPLALSRFVQDVKSGTGETNPTVAALDGALSPLQQLNIKAMVWARDKLGKLTT